LQTCEITLILFCDEEKHKQESNALSSTRLSNASKRVLIRELSAFKSALHVDGSSDWNHENLTNSKPIQRLKIFGRGNQWLVSLTDYAPGTQVAKIGGLSGQVWPYSFGTDNCSSDTQAGIDATQQSSCFHDSVY